MRVMVIAGSRNPEGQTARAVDAFVGGMKEAGAECDVAFLPTLAVERCRQCGADGWGKCIHEGHCTVHDDFGPLVQRIREADAAVFATPVYWSDLSESLRAFTDRLRRVCMHDDGKAGITGKRALAICVAGGGGGGAPACTDELVKVLGTCGFDVVDVVPARRQNLDFRLSVLRMTGRWFAQSPS